ncbi:MAG: EamA family transporter [Gluconacetobacter diazotrophicus]|nr:EamA family transporter [Gluconacetobacter diazotrophicus]
MPPSPADRTDRVAARGASGNPDAAAWSRNPWIVAALVGFVWCYTGGNYLAFKVASASLPPLMVATLRFVLSALVLLPIAVWRLRRGARPRVRELGAAAAIGVVMLVFGQTLSIEGTHRLPAGVSAVFAASSPLFIALLAWAVERRPPSRTQLAGILLGFAGLSLMGVGAFERSGIRPDGAVLTLLAGLFWAAGSVWASRLLLPDDMAVGLLAQLLPAGLILVLADAATGTLSGIAWAAVPAAAWASVAFLVLVSTVLGYAAFLLLNRHVSPGTANSFAYAAPVISIALSAVLLGERLTVLKLSAAAVALLGVAVMILGTPRRRPLPEIEPEATA